MNDKPEFHVVHVGHALSPDVCTEGCHLIRSLAELDWPKR